MSRVRHQLVLSQRKIAPAASSVRTLCAPMLVLLGVMAMSGCASKPPKPLIPYSADSPPMVMLPASMADVTDGRARFREIFCRVTEARGPEMPDHRPCEEALTKLSNEAPPSGRPVDLGASASPFRVFLVPGVGWGCFEKFIDVRGTSAAHVARFGHELGMLGVDALSSSARNAKLIRDAIMAMPDGDARKRIVLIGYSKGAPDILEAVTAYPELQGRVAAVVSAAGAVGGTPLAHDATQADLELLRYFPGAECDRGDGGALESLAPSVRQRWMANNPLPRSVRYYSLVAHPEPERISTMLRGSYDKLAQVDSRNDSQMIYYDQLIPGGTVLAYLNADHWAVALPIARSHPVIASALVDRNAFPREVLLEALLRYIEEDLKSPAGATRAAPRG